LDLLTLLSDQQFHSGEELGERLGISRAAVSKQMAHWREQGLELDVVNGKGYRLRQPLEWLDRAGILAAMSPEARALSTDLLIERKTGSTNDVVMQRLRERPQSGLICLAEQQTAGRGRRGRSWVSPPGCNFYGSLSWTFAEGFAAVEGLSLAVGVAVAEALERLGAAGLGLKWPNDLMLGDRKLGGVLLEMQGEAGGPCHLVVGVGINFYLSPEVAAGIDKPVTDLRAVLGQAVARNRATGIVLESLLLLLRDYARLGFAGWRERWLARDISRGLPVSIVGLAEAIDGVAQGVDGQGALLVQTGRGLQVIHGGEVSLRPGLSA
jgi:BirA family biotin operon repressor/biotin-[acetyl-CoA-carboxylase] ligase